MLSLSFIYPPDGAVIMIYHSRHKFLYFMHTIISVLMLGGRLLGGGREGQGSVTPQFKPTPGDHNPRLI